MPKPHPLSCGSRKYSSTASPSEHGGDAALDDQLGEKRPVSADPPRANTNIATDIGRIVTPVFNESKPSTVCK